MHTCVHVAKTKCSGIKISYEHINTFQYMQLAIRQNKKVINN